VNNGYFGDVKDLFKFDLIETLAKAMGIDQFTFVTMLTGPLEKETEGQLLKYEGQTGWHNKGLVKFLDDCVKGSNRDVVRIKDYFDSRGINTCIYGDTEGCFDVKSRSKYFNDINADIIDKAIIFIDPDIGFQIKKSKEKHVLFSEVLNVFRVMSDDSLLIVFQHLNLPWDTPEYTIQRVLENTPEDLRRSSLWLRNHQVIYFFFFKDSRIEAQLRTSLNAYQSEYPALVLSEQTITGQISDQVKKGM